MSIFDRSNKKKPKFNEWDLQDHIGMGAIIRDKSNKILMLNHNKFGFWTIPIGKAMPGDSAIDALKTEIREEVGIEVQGYKLITRKMEHYPRGEKTINVDFHLYDVTSYAGTPQNKEPQKHSGMKFMTIAEIKALPKQSDANKLMLANLPSLAKVAKQYKESQVGVDLLKNLSKGVLGGYGVGTVANVAGGNVDASDPAFLGGLAGFGMGLAGLKGHTGIPKMRAIKGIPKGLPKVKGVPSPENAVRPKLNLSKAAALYKIQLNSIALN
jgi:8-oxo-dGTP pyrophosphatase MutT (NUDIX family)